MQPKPKWITACSYCHAPMTLEACLEFKPTKYGRCCSMSCRSKLTASRNPCMAARLVQCLCGECGKVIELQPYRILSENFCSLACAGKKRGRERWAREGSRTLTVVHCAYCSTALSVPTWKLRKERNQSNHFCNRQCFSDWKSLKGVGSNNPAWRGGHTPYYGPNWRRQACRARNRDKHTCQGCGITEEELGRALDVHHKIRFGDFNGDWKTANRLRNLISYCHPCHMRMERKAA